jgi:MFS family permease
MLIPMMIGIMSGSVISGQLTARTGRYKIFPVIGAAMLTVAFFLLLTVQVDSSYWLLDSLFLMIGLGLGLNMQTMLIAVQNAVPARDMGVATSSATFFRQLGGTLGVAVFISLLFNSLPDKMTGAVQASATNPAFQQALAAAGATTPQQAQQLLTGYGAQMQTNSSFLQQIDPALALPFQQGFVDSTHLVYIVAGIIMFIAFLLVLMLKEVPLRTMSALQERQLEDAALMGEGAETLQEQVDEDLAVAAVRTGGAAEEASVVPPSPVTHGRHGLDEANSDPTEGPGKHAG